MQSENLFLGLPARGAARRDPRLVVRRRHAQLDYYAVDQPHPHARSRHADPLQDVGPEGRAAEDDHARRPAGGRPARPAQSLRAAAVRVAGTRRATQRRRRARAAAARLGARATWVRDAAGGRLAARARARPERDGRERSRLRAGPQRRPHQRRLHVRRGRAPGSGGRHADACCAATSAATRTSSSTWTPRRSRAFVGDMLHAAIRCRSRALRLELRHPPHRARASGRRPTGCARI